MLKQQLSFLKPKTAEELIRISTIQDFPKGTEILRENQYIKVLPVVITGLIKVFTSFEEKELLLYYIQPNQSCVKSFSAALKNQPCNLFARTEEDSRILLIPIDKVPRLLKDFPELYEFFYLQYDLRYDGLLYNIQDLLFNKLDKRLLDYLVNKSTLTNQPELKLTHGQIANELGTSREVISRVIKKLENEGKVNQGPNGIKITC